MKAAFVDLHCHSTASDGTLAPADVVRLAKESGLSALSLTDHDTIAGVAEAASAATEMGIDFISGIELSCLYPRPGTMHLLGYGIDIASPALAELTRILIEGRERRNLEMIRKLNDSGIPITLEEIEALAGGEVIGRPHMAAALVKKNIVSNTSEAFRVYLGSSGSAWVDKEQLTARQAIEMVHNAGGIAVLAHPSQLRKTNDAQLRAAIKDLVDIGLDGIDVIHTDHRESLIDKLIDIARRYDLLMTGGSDFHGANKPFIKLGRAGNHRIPRPLFDELRSRSASVRRAAG
ncbi:PHP domain-containing protein [soil metagenome]